MTRHHLPHFVTVQSRPATRDAFGQRVNTPWADELPNIRAHAEALSGRALLEAQAMQAETTWAVRIHYRAALLGPAGAARRVLHHGLVLDVLAAVPEDETRRYLRLLCSHGLHPQ